MSRLAKSGTLKRGPLSQSDLVVSPTWEELESQGKIKTIEDKVAYALACPDLFFVWPLGYKYAEHQALWLKISSKYQHVLLIAPNDHGKTETMQVGYALWRLANDHDLRIGIISYTVEFAMASVHMLKEKIEATPELALFGIKKSKTGQWSDKRATIERKLKSKDPSIAAIGFKGTIQNRRIDLGILDDVVDIRDYEAGTTIGDRIKTWFKRSLWTRFGDDGELKIIGTLQAAGDLYNWILTGETEDGIPMNELITCVRFKSLAKKHESLIVY